MNERPADVDLIRTGADDPAGSSPRRRSLAFLAVAAVAILALAGGYLYLRRARPEPAAAAGAKPDDAVKVRQDETAAVSLPPLEGTDPLVRQLVGALSSHPVVAAWLATDRLIVNFVVVTSRIADGATPAAELKAIGPVPEFRARTTPAGLSIDPATYHRFDRHAQAVASIDAHGAARVYETLKPRVMEAEKNFGGPADFDQELERAIVELLKVPIVDGPIALTRRGIGYGYADPRLEAMSAAQKQLFRMGPDNVRVVQGKLREIASYLSIPAARLPRPATLE